MQSKAMMAILPAIILMAAASVAQEPTLRWNSFYPPDYPRLARIAHLVGQVTLDFELKQNGTVVGTPKSTGHPIFVRAALESLKKSKLTCVNCGEGVHAFRVVYDFTVFVPEEGSSIQSVRDSADHILVSASLLQGRKARSIRCLYLWNCEWRYSPGGPLVVY